MALPLLASAPASALADGGESALSASAGYATFSTPGKPKNGQATPAITPDYGGSLSVIYERAISTDFSLRGELAGALFSGGATAKESSTSVAGVADVGAVFRFDVLKYVPYAFAGVGTLVSAGGPIDQGAELALAIGGGLDVLESRSWSWGFEGRFASFGGSVSVMTVGARGTFRWGYF